MKRFPGTREFIAVLEPATGETGRKPSELLKQLENPAHDAFEPERIVDTAALQKAKAQVKALISSVREIIRSEANIEDIDRSQLEELSHLFAAGGADGATDDENAEKDPDRFQFGEARKNQRAKSPAVGGKGASRRRRGPNKDHTRKVRTHKAKRKTTKPAGSRPTVPLEDVRSAIPHKGDGHARTIFFTPMADGDVEITVAATGLGDDVELLLNGTSSGKVVKGKLKTTVTAGQRTQVDVTFVEPFVGPIELSANSFPEVAVQGEA